jgi:hypothetical protein
MAHFKRRRQGNCHHEQVERKLFGVGFRVHVRARDRTALRAGRGIERFVHDAADGARAPPALRAAAETAIDLIGGGRPGGRVVDRRSHIAVAEDVAGTNDHCRTNSRPGWTSFDLSHADAACKKKNALLTYSKVLICLVFNAETAAPQRVRDQSEKLLNCRILRNPQASSTTGLVSVPMPGTDTSTVSPGLSQRGGSNRAPAPTGVPVTMMSPGLSVVKIVM